MAEQVCERCKGCIEDVIRGVSGFGRREQIKYWIRERCLRERHAEQDRVRESAQRASEPDASGADSLAHEAARDQGRRCEVFHADWERHGKAAGPIRNQAMIDAGADLVIAFPGGRGTADLIRRARKAGIPVREVEG
jgi:hypothetical protein